MSTTCKLDPLDQTVLTKWAKVARQCYNDHVLAYRKWAKVTTIIGVPIAVLSFVTSSALFATGDTPAVRWIGAALTFVLGVLGTIKMYFKTEVVAAEHSAAICDWKDFMGRVDAAWAMSSGEDFNRWKETSQAQYRTLTLRSQNLGVIPLLVQLSDDHDGNGIPDSFQIRPTIPVSPFIPEPRTSVPETA